MTDLLFGITVAQARIYATYFISLAKKYDGQYVGGGIDVYSIDQSGDNGRRGTRVSDAGGSAKREQEINLFQYKMDALVHRLSDTSSDLDYEFAMKEFAECTERFKNWTGKK